MIDHMVQTTLLLPYSGCMTCRLTTGAGALVLNNKTFAMSEVEDGELAGRISGQPAIDAGENIKLYCW